MWKKTLVPAIATLAIAALVTTGSHAGSDPVAKCLSSKQKAAGKKAAGKLGCYAKAATKAVSVDQDCLTKVEEKFDAAFAKADTKGPCDAVAADVETTIDQCVGAVVGHIPGADKCSGAKLKAAGKKAAAKLGCQAKATGKGVPVDTACLDKAEATFGAAFTKAGSCTGDPTTVENDVDGTCVDGVVAQVHATTTTTTLPGPVCGNNNVEAPETCDDGNTVDETDASVHPNPPDTCPKTCVIGSCSGGATQNVTVHFTTPGSIPLGGITVFLDYPDAKTGIPGSGGSVGSSITNVPAGSLSSPNDLDYGLLEGIVNLSGISPGTLFTVAFQNCPGAAPSVGDFGCYVKDASDTSGNDVAGVACSVTIP